MSHEPWRSTSNVPADNDTDTTMLVLGHSVDRTDRHQVDPEGVTGARRHGESHRADCQVPWSSRW